MNWTGSMGGVGVMFCGERRKRPNRDGGMEVASRFAHCRVRVNQVVMVGA
jgi:hypothetical protein